MLCEDPDQDVALEPVEVRLLAGFRLRVGRRELMVPVNSQRVLAYLAVCADAGQAQRRNEIAERLWIDEPLQRAQAILRNAIWRIRQADDRLLVAERQLIQLGPTVDVDLHRSMPQAMGLLLSDQEPAVEDTLLPHLVSDLLPGWDDEWLLLERERIHQIRIHALEILAQRLCRRGQVIPALNAAYSAIASEPLRESARAVLVELHMAQGNVVEARKQVEAYSKLLWLEMKLRPSDALLNRVAGPCGRPIMGVARTARVSVDVPGAGRRRRVSTPS